MRGLQWFVTCALLMIFGTGNALAAKKGDPKAGEAKSAVCQGCHGADGNSQDAAFPNLAGQYANYIAKQLKDFQSGKRSNNDTMTGMAGTVTDPQDIKDVAAYFSSKKMSGKSLTKPNKTLIAKGKAIYNKGKPEKGLYACVNCHGAKGHGRSFKNSVFPRIAGQHRDYLVKQLVDLKSGIRSNDPASMMANIAKKLTKNEAMAVATYLSVQ